MAHKLGKYFLASAYRTVTHQDENNSDHIPYQKEYGKIVRWIRKYKKPLDIRTMLGNRYFKNKPDAQSVLDEWVEYGLGIFVDEGQNLFVPLGREE